MTVIIYIKYKIWLCSIILGLMTILGLNSCVDTLNTEDLKWQPYKINDKIIYKSNNGQFESYTITEIEIYTNPNDHLAIACRYNQVLYVGAIGTDKCYKALLALHKFNKGLCVDLLFRPGNFTGFTPIYTVATPLKSNEFNGIKVLKINAADFYPDNYVSGREDDLDYVLWSKDFGYIVFFYKNGNYWVLVDFIRNNNTIYKYHTDR